MTTKPQIITLSLTKPQYDALAGAVATQRLTLDDLAQDGDRSARRDIAVLERAWTAVKTAWYRSLDGF